MNRSLKAILLLMVVGAIAGCSDTQTPVEPTAGTPEGAFDRVAHVDHAIPGRYMVMFNDGVGADQVDAVSAELGSRHHAAVDHTFRHAVHGFSAAMSAQDAELLASDPRVKLVEPDQVISIGQTVGANRRGGHHGGGGGGGGGSTQITDWGVTRVGGSHAAPSGVKCWVVDTGIDLNNSDLNVDKADSRDFISRNHPTPQDQNGHGTHVSGTIGAKNNSIGVVGVAAGAELVAVRVLDRNGSGTTTSVVSGLDYVASHGSAGDVVNMSLGGGASSILDQAVVNVCNAGIKVAIAAGNDAANANLYSPARVNHANAYTVSAIEQGDYFAWFSNFSNPPVDYAAPGVSITSLAIGGGTAVMSGTSMATPHVAGLLVLNSLHSDRTAINDPDAIPDPIAHY